MSIAWRTYYTDLIVDWMETGRPACQRCFWTPDNYVGKLTYYCKHCPGLWKRILCIFCKEQHCMECDNRHYRKKATMEMAGRIDQATVNSARRLPVELLTLIGEYVADDASCLQQWYCGTVDSTSQCFQLLNSPNTECGIDCGTAVANKCAEQPPANCRQVGNRSAPPYVPKQNQSE